MRATAKDSHYEAGLDVGANSTNDDVFAASAGAAVIDFLDDEAPQRGSRAKKFWDRKKKRFVGVAGDDEKSKTVRLDDGTRVRASLKTGIYERWQRRNRKMGGETAPEDTSEEILKQRQGE